MLEQVGDAKATAREAAALRKAALLGAFRRELWEIVGRPTTIVLDPETALLAGSPPRAAVSLFAAEVAPVAYFDDETTHPLSPQGQRADLDLSAKLLARQQLGRCLDLRCDQPAAPAFESTYTYQGDQRKSTRPSSWCATHRPEERSERAKMHAITRRARSELLNARAGRLHPVR